MGNLFQKLLKMLNNSFHKKVISEADYLKNMPIRERQFQGVRVQFRGLQRSTASFILKLNRNWANQLLRKTQDSMVFVVGTKWACVRLKCNIHVCVLQSYVIMNRRESKLMNSSWGYSLTSCIPFQNASSY